MTGRAHEALEADISLGGQLGWGFSPAKTLSGERRLMLAVLEDAVDCYRKGRWARDPATRLLFAETREWLDSTDGRALFSFESICNFLDIDADYVRRRLRQRRAPRRGGRRDFVTSRSEATAPAAPRPSPQIRIHSRLPVLTDSASGRGPRGPVTSIGGVALLHAGLRAGAREVHTETPEKSRARR